MWPSAEDPHLGVFAKNLSDALRAEGFDVRDDAVIRGKRRGRRARIAGHLSLLGGLAKSTIDPADALYVHAPSWFAPATLLAAIASKKKLIAHTHGGEVYPHSKVERISRPIVGEVLRRADLVIAPSRYYADELVRAFGISADRLFVSPSGGIDTQRFVPGDRTSARAALGLRPDGAIIGYVGRIERDKGWETILLATRALVAEGRDVRALFCGAGADREALERRAQELGIEARLVMLGLRPQAELPTVYQALDVFLFPTDRGAEALGLVPIEAMACGIPVVGSDRFAVPEYVIPGQTGFLAPPKDHDAFARSVARILDLSSSASTEMQAAATRMGQSYDARAAAKALGTKLDRVLHRA